MTFRFLASHENVDSKHHTIIFAAASPGAALSLAPARPGNCCSRVFSGVAWLSLSWAFDWLSITHVDCQLLRDCQSHIQRLSIVEYVLAAAPWPILKNLVRKFLLKVVWTARSAARCTPTWSLLHATPLRGRCSPCTCMQKAFEWNKCYMKKQEWHIYA